MSKLTKRLLLFAACLAVLACSGLTFLFWRDRGTEFTPAYKTIENGVRRYRSSEKKWPRDMRAVMPYLNENEARLVKQVLDYGIQVNFTDSGDMLQVRYRGESGLGGSFDIQRTVKKDDEVYQLPRD